MEHKRGDSFEYIARFPSTTPQGNWVGWSVRCQVRNSTLNKIYSELQCTWIDPVTTYDLRLFTADTSSWLLGVAVLDIQFVRDSDGYVRSTNTITFTIIPDVTQP